MFRLKFDENLPIQCAALFRDAGYDAMTALEQDMGGQSDAEISAGCKAEDRALVTLDLDFADIRNHPPGEYAGIIDLRLKSQETPRVVSVLRRLVATLGSETIAGTLWIVDESRIRIRG